MTARTQPIIVGIDGSSSAELALRWALDDGLVRNAPVHVICCPRPPAPAKRAAMHAIDARESARTSQDFARQAVDNALDQARGIAPELKVTGEVVDGHPAEVLIDRSVDAARVVVGSRALKALESASLGSVSVDLAARAQCPVLMVRGPTGLPAQRPAVVVGIDGTDTAEPALEFGFDHASRHGVPLRAVIYWRPDPGVTRQWRTEPPAREPAREWLAEMVAVWRRRYQNVVASGRVVRDHPVAVLVAQSAAQQLLVVRSRARHAPTGTSLDPVTQGVLQYASCPVAVIPAAT